MYVCMYVCVCVCSTLTIVIGLIDVEYAQVGLIVILLDKNYAINSTYLILFL